MKKRELKTKKLMALFLAAAMILAAGCGSTGQDPAGTQQAASEVSQDTETSEASQGSEEIEKLSIMVHTVTDIPEGSISDQWSKHLEEKVGVDIEWVLPPASAYEDNLQLTMINEDKPDVICFPTEWLTQTSFIDACESGMFLDISDMIGNYENLMAHTNEISWDALDIFNDGRIWGIPRSTVCRADGFLVREDWLNNLNIDYTEGEFMTLDQFYDLLYAFTYDDPDGNGVDDTWGLMLYSNADGSLNDPLSRIFHIGGG